MLDTKHSTWNLLTIFLQLDLFKFYPVILHHPCNNSILIEIFLTHDFFTLRMNKLLVVVFSKDTKDPIILNWLRSSPFTLHCNNTATLNIHIITHLQFFSLGSYPFLGLDMNQCEDRDVYLLCTYTNTFSIFPNWRNSFIFIV